MRTWAIGTARTAALTASFVALGASAIPAAAFADTTSGQSGVLGGNQVNLPISAPVDISGNGHGKSKGGATVHNNSGGGGGQQTSGKHGVASGNQVNAPISAPVNACGNALGVLGSAKAGCKGGATVRNNGGASGQQTSGKSGVASGNQINAPVSAPVNVCGNALAVFGSAEAGCRGGAKVDNGGHGGQVTDGTSGVIAGNQVNAPVSAPINICGNSAALFGDAVAGCDGGAKVKNGGRTGAGQQTSGKSSVGGGNQVNAPISAPVDVCGNAVGNATADCDGGASVRNGGHGTGSQTTNGDHSVLGGNQVNAPVSVPVSVCGNAVAVLGEAGAFCQGGAHVRSSSGGDQTTSGTGGVLAGNQVNAPVTIPVNVCGNAVAILGDAAAGCHGTAVVEGPQSSGNHTKGGNQTHAPTKAPVDVCGNIVQVAGKTDPQCGGNGPSWGGYHSYEKNGKASRTPGLPAVRELPRALPMSPAAALPAMPKLPAASDAARAAKPEPLPAVPSLGNGLPQLPLDTGRTVKGLPVQNPAARTATPAPAMDLPMVGALPVKPSALPLDPAALPADAATLPVDTKRPPVALPKVPHLPGTGVLPKVPVVPMAPAPAERTQAAGSGDLPGVDGVQLPQLSSLPVAGDVKAPETGGLPEVGNVTDTLGAVKPVAATEPMEKESGSVWVLVAAVVMTALSGTLALGRRLRPGRR
ncbi:hypothetical protein GCM10009678_02170 [Actinomadura kijaniata]|uniref:Chaplin domain-containing protein n=1 Tax=Actinomadura namibiensis TaxID=182080 RepID=A0A7W3LU12_ACTNM|nr:chaplin [Actinomadura namibiensis]MBA8954210.1 hypothetical protein [Actinomadura namibiensis]